METLTAVGAGHSPLPLSLSQREVWLDQRAWPDSTHLYIGGVAFLDGSLDARTLEEALRLLVAESDAMRLVPLADGSQQLRTEIALPFETVGLGDGCDLHSAVQDWWAQKLGQGFTWDTQPPWRFGLLQGGPGRNAIVMQYHHLMMDGWGTARVIQRWSELYNLLADGHSPSPSGAAAYCDFVEESNAYAKSEAFAKDAAYWSEQLPVLEPELVERKASHGGRHFQKLPAACVVRASVPVADYDALKKVATERNSTTFNYFLAAMVVYFARITNRATVVVGVPSLNRGGRRYRDTLGMFVGAFPVCVTLSPGMTVTELLSSIGLTMRGALRHARYPLSEMGRKLEVMRQGRGGLFEVLLSFERQDYGVSFGDARMAESRQLFCGKARYPLSVTVCEFQPDQDLEMVLEASTECFDTPGVEHLASRLLHLVQCLKASPDADVGSLGLLPGDQQAEIRNLHGGTVWHETTTPFIALFERQAALNPHRVAVVWDGGTLNYQELDRKANRLAQRLTTMGAARDRVIAVAMERSVELVVAVLAVSKAGAAFLPLDPDAPVARLAGILEESAPVALLIQEHNLERLAPLHLQVIVSTWDDAVPCVADTDPPAHAGPKDLAYVLFTSGSTGRPKGVMVEHGALSRRLAWLTKAYAVTPEDRSALSTQMTFDPALIELCLPLIHGASVALPPAGRLLPESLADFAIRHGATIIAFVPSTLSRFLDRAGGHPDLKLRVACCGGEVLPAELVNRYLKGTQARLFNVYGPTEACIFATAWECVPCLEGSTLPIGMPVDDTTIYVLDAQLNPLPLGVPGEVFIGGGALARGYMNRADLDAQAFIADPLQPDRRMYRTGDRGWLDASGNLHFVGRVDRQVKLRGYRIELGEIEAALMGVEGVTQAAVKVVQRNEKATLHAWAATGSGHSPDSLQRVLRVRLPDYMIPSGISILPELPTNNAGKIDYAALQEVHQPFAPAKYRPPNTDLERQILALWESVLEVSPLSVHDNFFDVGGDSLAAVSILAGIEKLMAARVPLFVLTENPTVEQLATALQRPIETPGAMVSFAEDSRRVPLYIAASGHGDYLRFQNLAHVLADTFNVRMLQPPVEKPVGTIAGLAHLYADLIEAQGVLPGYIAGFSIGGVTALETACMLEDRGLPVQGLILIDTIYPRAMWGGTLFWRLFVGLVKNLRLHNLTMNGRRLGAMVNDAGLVAQVMSMAGYRTRKFGGHTLLIKTSGLARWDRTFFKPWRSLFGGRLVERQISGLHGSIFETTSVHHLAEVLRDATRRQ